MREAGNDTSKTSARSPTQRLAPLLMLRRLGRPAAAIRRNGYPPLLLGPATARCADLEPTPPAPPESAQTQHRDCNGRPEWRTGEHLMLGRGDETPAVLNWEQRRRPLRRRAHFPPTTHPVLAPRATPSSPLMGALCNSVAEAA